MKRWKIALLALWLSVPIIAVAQTDTSTLKGVVNDKSGALVFGATVTAKNIQNGITRTTITNDIGYFILLGLTVGTYEITVEAQGFKKFILNDVKLTPGSNFLLAELEPGVVTEEVTIAGGSELIEKTTSSLSLGKSFELKQVVDLPVFNTNPLSLLVPELQVGRSNSTSFTLDGIENSVSQPPGMFQNISLDSVQEFSANTGMFSAENVSGGLDLINIVSRSGGNNFHGSAYFYLRDDKLQAKGPFGSPNKPSFDREQFGGSLGGPIVKDKAFFFFSLERIRENGATTVGHRNLAQHIIVPGFALTPFRQTSLTANFDFRPTDKNDFGVRYLLQDNGGIAPGVSSEGKLQDANNFQDQKSTYNQLIPKWTRTITPRLINELRFNLAYFKSQSTPLTTEPQVVFPSINVGANFLADRRSTLHQIEFKDDLTWAPDKHAFKFGADYSHFAYPEPANYNLFGPGIIYVPCDFPGDPGCPNARRDAEIPVLFALINRQELTDGFIGFGKRGAISALENNTIGLYAQDDFRARQNLTIRMGLRWDYDSDIIGKNQVNEFRRGKRRTEKKAVSPRFGTRWKVGRIIIRGGYGLIFYNNSIETRELELLANGVRLPIVRSVGGALADPFANALPGAPPDIFVTSDNLLRPYSHQVSIGNDIELGHYTISAEFSSNRGRGFQRRVEVNRRADGTRVNPSFGSVLEAQSIGKNSYDSLSFDLDKQFSHHFMLKSTYILSRSIDEDNNPFGYISSVSDPANHELDRGPSAFESRHKFTFTGVFDLVKGIQLSPSFQAFSSRPFEIIQNHDFSEGVNSHLFRLPGLSRNAGNRQIHTGSDVNKAIDAFNANPGLVRAHGGPIAHVDPDINLSHPFFSFDLRITKAFRLTETKKLQVGADVFNLFNHINVLGISGANSAGLQNNVESPDFGRPLMVLPGGVFDTRGPRAFQFSARFIF